MVFKVRNLETKMVNTIPVQVEVTYPWQDENRNTIISCEGFHESLKEYDIKTTVPVDTRYTISIYKGYLAAILTRGLKPPAGIYKSPEAMLHTIFKDIAEEYHLPDGQLKEHPLIRQVPEGHLGGGMVMVRHIVELRTYGTPKPQKVPGLAFSKMEENDFNKDAGRKVVEMLGFVPVS